MTGIRIPYKYLLIPFSLLLVAGGCSVEKNTASSRFYHGLTSRYNIYFNASESYKKGIEKVNNNFRDDYTELLKIFEFSDPATPSICSGDMERAIQKASKLITLKSITAKPELKISGEPTEKEKELLEKKEYNEWVDDSYLLMGKARLYTQDFEQAKSTLGYTISSSADKKIKNSGLCFPNNN